MKNIFFFVFSILLLSFQHSISQNVRFGIKGGGNICSLYGPDKPLNYDKLYGFSGGMFIDTRFEEHMSTLIEVNFTRYNFAFSEKIENIEDGYFNVSETNNYISVPIMLKYKRGYEFIFYYFSVGGQVSFLINNKRDVTATSKGLVIDATPYYDYKHNWYDYGLNGSVGFQFKPITVGLTYYSSMRNLYTRNDAREIRYNILSLNLSYQFNYRNLHFFDRRKSWKGLKYKIKHIFQ